MKFRKIVITICFLVYGPIIIQAQSGVTYPVINKPVPEFRLTQVKYYRSKIFDPGDLKGKWIILDFWNKGCTGCIKSFPKVNQLQNEFNDRIQFLLVGNNDKKYNDGIEKVYERIRDKHGLELSIAFDTTLIEQFGVNQYPYIIVIDPQSTVYAITGSEFLSRENMQALLDQKKPPFRRMYGSHDLHDSTYRNQARKWKYLISEEDTREIMYRSVLSENAGEYPSGSQTITKENVEQGYYEITKSSLAHLFNIAWWGESDWKPTQPIYSDHWKYPILELSDPALFQLSTFDNRGLYNYSLIVPKEKSSKEYLKQNIQNDLKSYFGYKVTIEKRVMPYWRLIATESALELLKRKTKSYVTNYGPTNIELRGAKMVHLLSIISQYSTDDIPFIDETNIPDEIEISFEAVMTDIKDVQTSLKKNGLVLEKSAKHFFVLVITDEKEKK